MLKAHRMQDLRLTGSSLRVTLEIKNRKCSVTCDSSHEASRRKSASVEITMTSSRVRCP